MAGICKVLRRANTTQTDANRARRAKNTHTRPLRESTHRLSQAPEISNILIDMNTQKRTLPSPRIPTPRHPP